MILPLSDSLVAETAELCAFVENGLRHEHHLCGSKPTIRSEIWEVCATAEALDADVVDHVCVDRVKQGAIHHLTRDRVGVASVLHKVG